MTNSSMEPIYARIAADIAAEIERRRVRRQRMAIGGALVAAMVGIEVMTRWL